MLSGQAAWGHCVCASCQSRPLPGAAVWGAFRLLQHQPGFGRWWGVHLRLLESQPTSACHQHTAAQGSCPRQLCCVHAATPASAWGSCVLCVPHAATPTSNCLPLLEAHRRDPMSPSAASVTSGVHSACCIPGFQLRPWLQAHHNDPTSPSAAGSRPPGLPRMPLAPTSLNTPRTGGSSMGPPGVSPSSSSAVSTLTGGHQCTSPA